MPNFLESILQDEYLEVVVKKIELEEDAFADMMSSFV